MSDEQVFVTILGEGREAVAAAVAADKSAAANTFASVARDLRAGVVAALDRELAP